MKKTLIIFFILFTVIVIFGQKKQLNNKFSYINNSFNNQINNLIAKETNKTNQNSLNNRANDSFQLAQSLPASISKELTNASQVQIITTDTNLNSNINSTSNSTSNSNSNSNIVPIDVKNKILYEKCDIDLSNLNTMIVYSELYKMNFYPNKYVNKIVKVTGMLGYFKENNQYHYACLVNDQTACCALGIEFLPNSSCNYPENLPPLETEITVTGVFKIIGVDGLYALTNALVDVK